LPYGIAFLYRKQGTTVLVLKWVDENGLQARWEKVSLAVQPEMTENRSTIRSDALELRNRRIIRKDAA